LQGWIKIHRQLQDNPLWTCESFTRGQAWIDLLLLASHKDTFFYKRGVKISLKRGQVGVSGKGLAERWGWSRTKVNKFLLELEKEHQIGQQKNNVTQIVTIVNYAKYQANSTPNDTPERHQKDTFKNVKEQQELFKGEVETFADKYDMNMLTAFYSYWSELNQAGTKMKKDMQDTWETNRRLAYWHSRNYKNK